MDSPELATQVFWRFFRLTKEGREHFATFPGHWKFISKNHFFDACPSLFEMAKTNARLEADPEFRRQWLATHFPES